MTDRKREHIELAFKLQTTAVEADSRFIWKPLLSEHPIEMQAKGLSLAEAFLRINPDYLGLSADDLAFAPAEADAQHQAFNYN